MKNNITEIVFSNYHIEYHNDLNKNKKPKQCNEEDSKDINQIKRNKKEIGIECNIEEEQSKPPNLIKQTSVS